MSKPINTCAVILAGGQGKRMKSDLPKPMFKVLDMPMLDWVIKSCEDSGITDICVVTGFNREVIEKHLDGKYHTVYQSERKGTGHAVMMAEEWLRERSGSNVLILNGDAPFIDKETILGALWHHESNQNAVTVITAEIDNPKGYGRILRTADGISGIVEEKDATDEQKAIREINSGAYWFSVDRLIDALGEIKPNNAQGEYYLTDSVFILIKSDFRADAYISPNSDTVLGANDRKGLLMLNNTARFAIINRLMDEGVEFTCTDGVTIGRDVTVGAGTVILQGVIIKGNTVIGENCVIGPNCIIENCTVGKGVVLNTVQSYDSVIDDNVKIGPFVQIRPGSHIKSGVKIGDFVEIKDSVIGENTSVSHLTYVGDSDVGSGVNFGCGTVTSNYDGQKKFRTVIGDNAFIGCNTNLIAPVKIGNAAYTGAGSTITKDVPDGALAVERGDTKTIEGFGSRKLKDRIEKNSKA
ncbi:MAG: bifunctional UDP-N-acetylglucosamine diphosphorylase/glucosamine-1-phosphate N-acetyltransferase GlmU [Oscillospiraceae bacterium]|nr:bifunctional UDP-N-acetylglucosamine diphosphorylase/glucosamine-1-phosphate N-acetyltransferase GlmU [Oscillospiraceae bacterium]